MERFSLVLWETAAFGFSLFFSVGGEMAVFAGGCGGSGCVGCGDLAGDDVRFIRCNQRVGLGGCPRDTRAIAGPLVCEGDGGFAGPGAGVRSQGLTDESACGSGDRRRRIVQRLARVQRPILLD